MSVFVEHKMLITELMEPAISSERWKMLAHRQLIKTQNHASTHALHSVQSSLQLNMTGTSGVFVSTDFVGLDSEQHIII